MLRILMTLVLKAALTNSTFMRGEEIYLTLDVSNSGSKPVEVGRPVSMGRCWYTLTTPEGQRLHADGSAPLNPSIPGFEWGKTPEPTSVAPDVCWGGCVNLGRLFAFETNGRYRLEMGCSWDQIRLESGPLEFQIEDVEVLQLSRASEGDREQGDSCLLILKKAGEGRELLYSQIQSVHDECGYAGIPKLGGPHVLRSLPREAVDPVHPSSNPFAGGLNFKFWREGNSLRWIYVSHDKTMPLPGTVDRLLDPALEDGKSGLTHVYALSSTEGVPRLVVVRVMAYLKDGYQPERVLAELPLEAKPLGGAAEIDRVRGGLLRSVILGGMKDQAPRADWMSYAGDAVPDKLRAQVWTTSPAAEPIPDARPAILASKDGSMRIAWIVREAGRPERGLFCEAELDASGALKSEGVSRMEAGAPILAARTRYLDGKPLVALWTEDGGIRAGWPTALKQLERPGGRRVPPTLVVFHEEPFVLDWSPVQGLVFVLIPGDVPRGRRR
jgi:hypothetical protein